MNMWNFGVQMKYTIKINMENKIPISKKEYS